MFTLAPYSPMQYAPTGDITLYYWYESDFEDASVLTRENASGPLEDSGEYCGGQQLHHIFI